MVRFVSLYSGSDKNSAVFSYKNTNIMIDCGGSFKQLKEQLDKVDLKFSDIDALFITHSHTDHIKSLPMIIKNTDIPVYTSFGTHEEIFDMNINMPKDNRIIIYDNRRFSVGNIDAECFKTPHDTKYSIGFNVYFKSKTATFATDIGCVTDELKVNFKGRDFVFLESNHDVEMLNNSNRPYSLKRRILSDRGHLSNEISANFSKELATDGLRRLMLGHLSGEANTPGLAYEVTKQKMENNGIKIDKDILLRIAQRGILSDIIDF